MSVPDFPDDFPVVAKIRYNHRGTKAHVRRIGADRAEVIFEEPVRAVTPDRQLYFMTASTSQAAAQLLNKDQTDTSVLFAYRRRRGRSLFYLKNGCCGELPQEKKDGKKTVSTGATDTVRFLQSQKYQMTGEQPEAVRNLHGRAGQILKEATARTSGRKQICR